MCVNLCTKFQVSSIILMSFRRANVTPRPTSKRAPKKPTQIRVSQKNTDYIDDSNIKEDHLGIKKIHLNKRGNSVFAKNLLRYLRSKY